MGAEEVKKLEGLGTKGMCIRLVLLPRSVGKLKMFMDKLELLKEHCVEKNVSLKYLCIPTLLVRIGI